MMIIFTVIGNVLFCHIIANKEIVQYENIVEIPPEIYKRMLNKSNIFIISGVVDEVSASDYVMVGVTKNLDNKKYYIYTANAVNSIGSYLIGYYMLKDI